MIKNIIKQFSNRTIKIKDKAIWINVENQTGGLERIVAFEGESLYDALKRSQSKIYGDCGNLHLASHLDRPVEMQVGSAYCSQCHVIIGHSWFEKMERDNEIHYLEKEDLKNLQIPKNSRFACFVRVENWMDEMKIKLSQLQENNLYSKDEFF